LKSGILVFGVVALSICVPAFGQQAPPPAAEAAAATPADSRSIEYGVRFGPAFTSLTSPDTFDPVVAPAAFEPAMHFGGFFTLRLFGPFSFQPELLVAAKGHRLRQKDAEPVPTLTGFELPPADQVVLLRYFEFPMLLRLSRQVRSETALYLIGGPAFAIRRNAVIREVDDSSRRVDISDEVTANNLSAVFGAGAQHERWLVDARMTIGLRNVAVVPQPAEVKTSAFSVLLGVRF
jgi:hypothetical protein